MEDSKLISTCNKGEPKGKNMHLNFQMFVTILCRHKFSYKCEQNYVCYSCPMLNLRSTTQHGCLSQTMHLQLGFVLSLLERTRSPFHCAGCVFLNSFLLNIRGEGKPFQMSWDQTWLLTYLVPST